MKTKKLLSLLTAAAISISSFAAFAVTASADEPRIDKYTVEEDKEYVAGATIYGDDATLMTIQTVFPVKSSSQIRSGNGLDNYSYELGSRLASKVDYNNLSMDNLFTNGLSQTTDYSAYVITPKVDGEAVVHLRIQNSNNTSSIDGKNGARSFQVYDITDKKETVGTTELDPDGTTSPPHKLFEMSFPAVKDHVYLLWNSGYSAGLLDIILTENADNPSDDQEKAGTTYTWDFTDGEWFTGQIEANNEIKSDQNEATAILYTNVRISKQKDKVGSAVSAKTEASQEKAIEFRIPAGKSAKLDIQLALQNNSDKNTITDENGNVEETFTQNNTNKTLTNFSFDLECSKTYYLNLLTDGRIYIGKITLTVYPNDEENDDPEMSIAVDINEDIAIETENAESPAKPYTATFTISNGSKEVKGAAWKISDGGTNSATSDAPIMKDGVPSSTTITSDEGGSASIIFGLIVTGTVESLKKITDVTCELY